MPGLNPGPAASPGRAGAWPSGCGRRPGPPARTCPRNGRGTCRRPSRPRRARRRRGGRTLLGEDHCSRASARCGTSPRTVTAAGWPCFPLSSDRRGSNYRIGAAPAAARRPGGLSCRRSLCMTSAVAVGQFAGLEEALRDAMACQVRGVSRRSGRTGPALVARDAVVPPITPHQPTEP